MHNLPPITASEAPQRLRVLTLNLHTWQEERQQEKFRTIADAIRELEIDIACFQEVGELWNDGRGDPATHAGRIIRGHLGEGWHLFSDWSHVGFDRYREGVAILSRFPFKETGAAWLSSERSPWSIHARKAVRARILLPGDTLDVVSTHFSWPENGFFDQFRTMETWLDARADLPTLGTLVCGDFNVEVSSPAFARLARETPWREQFMKATAPETFRAVFEEGRPPPPGDSRIDYLWLSPGNALVATAGAKLFTPERYGPVSDHPGYAVEFALPSP